MSNKNTDGASQESATEKARKLAFRQLPKRFYKEVSVEAEESGFSVRLDGRPMRTPARNKIMLPTREAALLVENEFSRQVDVIDPATMPVTRLANTAIDGVSGDPQPVLEDILRFASSDLLCYRACHPQALVDRQNASWDPVLEWAQFTLGANLAIAEGVMHIEQPRQAIAAIGQRLRNHTDPFVIAGLHVMTSLTGSALLAMAVVEDHLDADQAWAAAHVDEDWNISQWGEDAEAAENRERRRSEMMAAASLIKTI
jgi:chaperone required for assembly of F1-ATPase